MCGFLGRINLIKSGDPPGPPVESGLAFLKRRGPDSNRTWSSSDGRVELLHVRLAIVDVDSRAEQPFSDPSGRYTVAFNGEIYNYEKLRRELSDYPFRTLSDTEVILAAFARWGVDGFRRMRGMFALALVDSQERRVYLVRDPVGKKPLYLSRAARSVGFGSSVLPLVAISPDPARLRMDRADIYYRYGYVPPDESIVDGCRPLLPGEVVILDWEGKAAGATHCVPPVPSFTLGGLEDSARRVEDLLLQSVERRMRNNPNPVSLLSGGIDSTVVTLSANRIRPTAALTLRGNGPLEKDEKFAQYAARRMGVRLQAVTMQGTPAREVAWALDLQDEPLGMISFLPLALLIRTCKEYGKILLSGDGGDEVFMGYGAAPDWTKPTQGASEYPSDMLAISVGLPPSGWMSPWGKVMVGHSLLGHGFAKADRASAEQGVELRCPLVDWDLIAFVRQLPPEHMLQGGVLKYLLKAQLKGWPSWFLERSKVGFAYRLRWLWGLRRYAGLRELIDSEAVELFAPQLTPELRTPARHWKTWTIFRNFNRIWPILAWSRFQRRFAEACRLAQTAPGAAGRPPAPSRAW